MANVALWGANYNDVPSVMLPKQGGGTVSFDDTTDANAVASDIAQGKTAYVNGVKLVGTASGGSGDGHVWQDQDGYVHLSDEPGTHVDVESLSVTANGTYTAPTGKAYSPVTVGVTSNIVQGTFTTDATRNQAQSVSIPYSGTGYPIALMVFVANGAYNNGTGGNTTWYNSLSNRYDVGAFYMTKSRTNTAPDYTTSGENNYGVTVYIYKSSSSSATTYSRSSSMTANTYTSSSTNATSGNTCCRFKGNGKTLSVYIGNNSTSTYGLPPSTLMQYIVVYSS